MKSVEGVFRPERSSLPTPSSMLSPLARRVARAIRDRQLWGESDRVAIAVSGGADSVALALLLAELSRRGRWTLAGLIHVNHGLRLEASDADADFCRDLAARLGVPIDVSVVDVRRRIGERKVSVEVAARELRYEAFTVAVGRLGATVVATGHTADDQAETVLLRLLRGATTRGGAAIRFKRGQYARPLLTVRRTELRRYLDLHGQPHREDASNADLSVPRNRLRAEVMPRIEEAWPGGVRALARFARLAGEDERWLSAEAEKTAEGVVHSTESGVELIEAGLAKLPGPLARRVVRDAIERLGGRARSDEIEAVLGLVRADMMAGRLRNDPVSLDLHRIRAVRCAGRVELALAGSVEPAPAGFVYELSVPGEVQIVETGARVRASFLTGPGLPPVSAGWDAVAAIQAGLVSGPLLVRSRNPGDRFRPLGAPGQRKLQDVFVDRKVPRRQRDQVPVVADDRGRIVWVAGVALAHPYRVTAPEDGMVILEMQKGKQ